MFLCPGEKVREICALMAHFACSSRITRITMRLIRERYAEYTIFAYSARDCGAFSHALSVISRIFSAYSTHKCAPFRVFCAHMRKPFLPGVRRLLCAGAKNDTITVIPCKILIVSAYAPSKKMKWKRLHVEKTRITVRCQVSLKQPRVFILLPFRLSVLLVALYSCRAVFSRILALFSSLFPPPIPISHLRTHSLEFGMATKKKSATATMRKQLNKIQERKSKCVCPL